MNDDEFEAALRTSMCAAVAHLEAPSEVIDTLAGPLWAVPDPPRPPRQRRSPRWLYPVAAAAAVVLTAVPVALVHGSHHHKDTLASSTSPATTAAPPTTKAAPSRTASAIPTHSSSAHTSAPTSTPPESKQGSTQPPTSSASAPPSPVGVGGTCANTTDVFGSVGAVTVETGRVECAEVLDMLTQYRAAAPAVAAGYGRGPVSVGSWSCQSGPSDSPWTVCDSHASTVAVGQNPPTPWLPFNPRGGLTPQFYYDSAHVIRQYPSDAGYGSTACHYTIPAQTNPPNAPTATQLGVSVTVTGVHVVGQQVAGTVVVRNVSAQTATLQETLDIAADQLMNGGTAVTPGAGWDGPLLGLRQITLAPGASTSAEHLLPAYSCAGTSVNPGTYTAQFYVGLQVAYSGAQLDYALPAASVPSVSLG